jgi:hypothetical protein
MKMIDARVTVHLTHCGFLLMKRKRRDAHYKHATPERLARCQSTGEIRLMIRNCMPTSLV